MQDALLTLTRYWTEHGCMIVQPLNTEVGAGTLNPATALRVLGPEPWRVAYAEPSVPVRAEQTLEQLAGLLRTAAGQELAAAISRIRRIVPAGTAPGFDQALFDSPAEHSLAAAFGKTREAAGQHASLQEFAAAAAIAGPVNDFFDQVLVMADDPAVRANRLGLLASVYQLAARHLDWAQLR